MSGRFFLDTNIFVYSFDTASPKKAAQSAKLIRSAIETRGGVVSYQVVQEFFNVALRRFRKPMGSADAEQYLSTTFRPLLSVHSSPALYGEALRIGARFRLAWYDSLIVASAKVNVTFFTARTFRMGRNSGALWPPTPLPNRRTLSKRNGSERASPRTANQVRLVAGASNHSRFPPTFSPRSRSQKLNGLL